MLLTQELKIVTGRLFLDLVNGMVKILSEEGGPLICSKAIKCGYFSSSKQNPSFISTELNEQRSVHFCLNHLTKHLIHQMTFLTEVAHCFIKTQKQSNRNQHLFS